MKPIKWVLNSAVIALFSFGCGSTIKVHGDGVTSYKGWYQTTTATNQVGPFVGDFKASFAGDRGNFVSCHFEKSDKQGIIAVTAGTHGRKLHLESGKGTTGVEINDSDKTLAGRIIP